MINQMQEGERPLLMHISAIANTQTCTGRKKRSSTVQSTLAKRSSDRHLLATLGAALASNTTFPRRRGWSPGLALKDLPKLQTFVGGCLEKPCVSSLHIPVVQKEGKKREQGKRKRDKPTGCSQHLPIGTKATVQHTSLMGRDLHIANQGWITPDTQ